MDAPTRFRTQPAGALPAIAHYFDELGLAATVDDLVPREGDTPLGTLVEIPVASRLLQPKALFRIGPGAQSAALAGYYGLTPEQRNDDRLGRALERPGSHAQASRAALVLNAIDRFEWDVTQVHYDLTTVELYGAYEAEADGPPGPAPRPTYGRAKSGREHVKQAQLGLDVVGGGGVPVGHLPPGGNAAEVTTHLDNLRPLARALPRGKLLDIGDTKLDAPKSLRAIAARKGPFLCGGALSPQLREQYLGLRDRLRPADYSPASQAQRPPAERDQYRATEVAAHLDGAADGKAVGLGYRVAFVWSQSKARREAAPRERHAAKVRAAFEAVPRNPGRYSLTTAEAIARRPEAAEGEYPGGAMFTDQLGQGRGGRFHLSWGRDAGAPGRRQAPEGVYALRTDLPGRTHPVAEALRAYKGRSRVERRFRHRKGPPAVAPMFLKNPGRIAGLWCVLVGALMVPALMERQVRRELGGEPLYGLYPEGRPRPSPTGPSLIEGLSGLCVGIVRQGGKVVRRLAEPDPVQRRIIQLLGIDAQRLRTFRRRCGT